MQRKNSISFKITASLVFSIVVIMAAVGIYSYLTEQQNLHQQIREQARQKTLRLTLGLKKPFWDFDHEQVKATVNLEIQDKDTLAILVRKMDNAIYYGLFRDYRKGILPLDNNNITRIYNRTDLLHRFSMPIKYKNQAIGTVEVLTSNHLANLYFQKLILRTLLQTILLTAIISTVIFFVVEKLILNPLISLNQSVQLFSQKDFDVRVVVSSEDELGQLGRNFNSMADTIQEYNRNLEEKVRKRTEEVQEKNRKILESLSYAKRIQESILPRPEQLQNITDKYFVIWRPRDIVGGDFYWSRDAGNRHFIAVGDCTGHGIPGAFMTMTVNALLNNVIDEICNNNPATIISELNRLLKETLHQDRPQSRTDDGLDLGLCMIDKSSKRLIYSGAHMSLFMHIKDPAGRKTGEVQRIKGDRQSVGYIRSSINYQYQNHVLDLSPETTFYLTSDGLLDQSGGTKGFGFGPSRFKHIIAQTAHSPLEEQRIFFEQELDRYMRSEQQRDDITVFAFQLDGLL